MSNFTVYFSASTSDVIDIQADDWEIDNHNILNFSTGDTTVACFNMNNIFGFEENDPVKSLAGKNVSKAQKVKSAER